MADYVELFLWVGMARDVRGRGSSGEGKEDIKSAFL